jgi:hypothetical protein
MIRLTGKDRVIEIKFYPECFSKRECGTSLEAISIKTRHKILNIKYNQNVTYK